MVAALQDALNQVWGVKPDPESSGLTDFFGKRILSLAMILGLGFLLLVSLVVSSVLAAVGEQTGQWTGMSKTLARGTNFFVQGLVVIAVFTAIFKFMPDAKAQWWDVLIGAMVTTTLFLIGRYAMQHDFSMNDPAAQFSSAAASLAVLLVCVHYTAMIVLLGAEVTQVYAIRNHPQISYLVALHR